MEQEKKKLILIGSEGMLAQMVKRLMPMEYAAFYFDLPKFDITDRKRVLTTLMRIKPNLIVNCAAYTDVDGCESNEDLAFRVNGVGPGYLAEAAVEIGATLVHISTDYVFPGDQAVPYREEDPPEPLSVYGRSKLAGEKAIIYSGLTHYFILRTSWLFGPGGKNFVETILRLASEKEMLRIVSDQHGSPTYTEDLAKAIFSLLETAAQRSLYGVYHFSNNGSCSRYEFAGKIISFAQSYKLPVKVKKLLPIRMEEYPLLAKRPANSVFCVSKFEKVVGQAIPSWETSLYNYFKLRNTEEL